MSIRNNIITNVLDSITVIKDGDYDARVAKIQPFDENYKTKFKGQTPLLMVKETGEEVQLVADATHDRFQITIEVTGYLKGGSHETLQKDSNNLVAALKRFANSDPDLGTNALAMFWFTMPGYIITSEESVIVGQFQVIYWTLKGTY